MTVNFIVVNGQRINTPGAYGSATYPASIGNAAPLKRLAVPVELPYLPQNLPLRFSSKEALEAVMPTDLELLRISSIIYGAARDERVQGGPADVYLINPRPNTQAFFDLLDGDDVPSIRLRATVWGPKGNQTSVEVAEDDDAFALTVARDGMIEPFTAIRGQNLFSLQYTGPLDSVGVASVPGGDFVLSGQKAAIAVGLLELNGHPWDGVVEIQPSVAPGVDETFSALVTAINEAGASETQELTWAAGESAVKATTIKWSRLTSVLFSEVGASTPTFTLSGEVLRAEPGEFPTVFSLAHGLSKVPYTTAFTVTSISGLAGSVRLDQMDPADDDDIKTAAFTFKNVKQVIVEALGASGLVTAQALTTGGAPVAQTIQLAGGSVGVTQSTDWDAAWVASRMVAAQVYCPMSDLDAVHAGALAHTNFMAGPGAYDCNVWVGAASMRTKDQLRQKTQSLNSTRVSVVGQDIERRGPLGTMEWLPPKYLALLLAAIQCGTREAVTYKIPDVAGYRQHPSWSPDRDASEMHDSRVTILGRTLEEGTPDGQIRVLRALTTYWGSSDPCRTDVRPVESIADLLIFARSFFRQRVGGPTTAPLDVITKLWVAVLDRAVALGLIEDFKRTSAKAVRIGNVTSLMAAVKPIFSNDFFDINVGAVADLDSPAGFQLALAA
ncbi:MAG TPA: hypothetical protein PK095_00465 [Myxococcota bacterium]|nr:hypothetical protein [Myxococcota bacterium]